MKSLNSLKLVQSSVLNDCGGTLRAARCELGAALVREGNKRHTECQKRICKTRLGEARGGGAERDRPSESVRILALLDESVWAAVDRGLALRPNVVANLDVIVGLLVGIRDFRRAAGLP